MTPSFVLAELPTVDDSSQQRFSGSEYYVGRDFGKPLISVKLLNGVQKPGVYHVPVGTDISDIISYAGGSDQRAHLDEILLRRKTLGKVENFNVDLEKLLGSTSSIPKLQDEDVIYIEQDIKLDQTLRWVSIVSGIATIALTVFLISDRNND